MDTGGRLVALSPYPSPRVGASGFIGWSAAARADARRIESDADAESPYPDGTTISRTNQPSRMFNVMLTDEQFRALQNLAREHHLPMSTMARACLLDRLDQERHAS